MRHIALAVTLALPAIMLAAPVAAADDPGGSCTITTEPFLAGAGPVPDVDRPGIECYYAGPPEGWDPDDCQVVWHQVPLPTGQYAKVPVVECLNAGGGCTPVWETWHPVGDDGPYLKRPYMDCGPGP